MDAKLQRKYTEMKVRDNDNLASQVLYTLKVYLAWFLSVGWKELMQERR